MEIILDKFLGQIINALCGAIIAYLIAVIRQKNKENNALKEGVQALLRDRIIEIYYHYTEKGWMPLDVRNSLEALYNSYEALGENGVINDLMEQLRELPNHKPVGGANHA